MNEYLINKLIEKLTISLKSNTAHTQENRHFT